MTGLWLLAALAACGPHRADALPEPPKWQERHGGDALRLDLARAFLEQGASQRALDLLAEVEDRDRQHGELVLLQGWGLREQGALVEAEALLTRATEALPRDARPYTQLGLLYAEEQRRAEAAAAFRRATELAPDDASTWNNLGFVQTAAAQTEEAVASLQRAVALDGSQTRYRNNLGFAYASAGRWEDAASAFTSANPPLDAQLNLGLANELADRKAQALVHYQRALEYNPSHPAALSSVRRLSAESP
ncbi:MAG: tetratricopeptide repeat protein [Deltaproteobacteria bacterium]|nr:tetratricopeptide repeat protein [Deltaproteobacteria bacterium]